jgi:polyisoprenoid-binding protein YceI
MSPIRVRSLGAAHLLATTLLACSACSKNEPAPAKSNPSAEAPSAVVSAPPASGMLRFVAAPMGTASYVIDAPVEKGKGKWTVFRGTLDIDPSDLTKTRGQVEMDLDDLKTSTFDDPGKNATQTEHAHNWFEIGNDVTADVKERNRWARFTIRRIEEAAPTKVADAPGDGPRTVKVVASGDLLLHGVTKPKTVRLTAVFTGPADAPRAIKLTGEPFGVSLSEHDVKPRDALGKFISGSLEVVLRNKKIVDTAQVSIEELTLRREAP